MSCVRGLCPETASFGSMEESTILNIGVDPKNYLNNGYDNESGKDKKPQKHAVCGRFLLTIS